MPSPSERATSAFYLNPVPAARISGHFTLSLEAKSASRSRVPMSCDSERAASTFYLITKFGFLFKLWRPSTKRTVPDFARITRDCVVPTLPLN